LPERSFIDIQLSIDRDRRRTCQISLTLGKGDRPHQRPTPGEAQLSQTTFGIPVKPGQPADRCYLLKH
jgi:hypothetical protein